MLSGFTSYALFTDNILSDKTITFNLNRINETKVFTYTGSCEEYTAKYTGYYKIEAYGAQGGYGYSTTYYGGNGGYISGITKLVKGETLYVCVGGKGNNTTTTGTDVRPGGYNGGANTIGTTSKYTGSGGGATDIRLVGGSWDSEEGLNSRIIVAAGGGAGGYESSWYGTGGNGGGLIGGSGTSSSTTYTTVGNGGTQTSGGTGYADGSFGKGGAYTSDYIGGAGGYYGGGAGIYTAGSGGGSSFISGYAGVNAITSSTDRTHTNDTLHYSNKYFINAKMEAGTNSGTGKAKITYVSSLKPERVNTNLNNVRYIKDCTNGSTANTGNYWVEMQAIYNGVNVSKGIIGTLYNEDGTTTNQRNDTDHAFSLITDGDIDTESYAMGTSSAYTGNQCFVIDLEQTYDLDEVAVWHYYGDSRTSYDSYTYVSSDNSNWTLVIDKQEPETSEGKRASAYEEVNKSYVFTYTGSCEEFNVEKTGYYKLEAWGAQGGNTDSSTGGLGGYASGITKLIKGETLYVCVGENLNTYSENYSFNGGGKGSYQTSGEYDSTNGGGATDIRLISGSWDDEEGLNSRIMVAAGGGGSNESWGVNGGNAGGLIGGSGYNIKDTNGSDLVLSTGGTQTSGGTGAGSSAKTESPYVGDFGIGGSSNATSSAWIYRSGGGSGYYGGGTGDAVSSNVGSAAGGSSFISGYAGVNAITSSTDRTHTNNTLHYSNKYFINTEMKSGVRTGNGKAVITYISEERPERTNTSLNNVRYIKDCINGSNRSTSNHWGEVQAIYNGVNVALGKEVTSTGTINDEYGTGLITSIVDGNILSDNFARFDGDNQCVTIDLGQTYDLDEIAVWHRWDLDYTYNDNYTYISSDNETWVKVIDRQEPEASQGKRVNAYEGTSLTIKQNTGGTLTCTNNTTNQTSTSSLSVTKGDSITCSVSVSSGYKSTSIKIGSDSITSGTSFTYDYDTSTTIIPKYYKYCSSTIASYGNWGSCSASCGGGTMTRTITYYDATYTSYWCSEEPDYGSCNTQSCDYYTCVSGNTYVFDDSKYASYISNSESFRIVATTTSCPYSSWGSCYIITPNSIYFSNRNGYWVGVSGYGSNYGYIYPGCVSRSGYSCDCNNKNL